MSTLTEEQRKRIEENRRKALEKRALKSGFNAQNNNQIPPVIINKNSPSKFNTNTSTGSSSAFQAGSAPLFPSSNTFLQKTASNVTNNAKPSVTINAFFQKATNNNVINNAKPSVTTNAFPQKATNNNVINNAKPSFTSLKPHEYITGRCILQSRKRFYVDVTFHKELIEIFKSVPGRMYDMQTKKWNFSIDDHDRLVSLVKPLQPSVLIAPLPHRLVKLFKDAELTKQIKEYDLSHMDPTLVNALLPFQKTGLYFGIQHGGRVLLADDMGLGKTIQGIAIANYFIKDWPLLVVTPSSVRYSWLDAFRTWLPTVETHEISVINSGKDHIPNDKVIIMSYDLLTKMQNNIINRKFRSVIFDESHFLKNHKTARTKAAQAVMKGMVRIIMLSGTPALSRPIELFTQVSALCPKYFCSFNEYGIRYCNGKQMQWGWDFSGSSNMKELQLVLEELVMLRRLKSDVMTQLPAKSRQMVILDPSRVSSKSKILKALYQKMCKTQSSTEKRGALLEYFHETGSVKIPAVCDYILDLLESDKKFLCFAHHQNVLNSVCDAIDKKKVDYIRIDGAVQSEQRKKLCDRFQLNDSCKVAVLSITAANCGITLTAASLVVFAELFWNPGILTQAEDRAHRIGQEDHVVVQYLVAKGTADDEIWPLVQRKLDILNKAGLSKDNFKTADTVVKQDSSQLLLDDLLEDLSQRDNFDIDLTSDIPEKRLKLDL